MGERVAQAVAVGPVLVVGDGENTEDDGGGAEEGKDDLEEGKGQICGLNRH